MELGSPYRKYPRQSFGAIFANGSVKGSQAKLGFVSEKKN